MDDLRYLEWREKQFSFQLTGGGVEICGERGKETYESAYA
jgi:hypothetical protein